MSYFARINENGTVTGVLSVPDSEEHRGGEFLASDLGLGGQWVQTSYNTRGGIHYDPATGDPSTDQSKALRKNYGGIGYSYDEQRDAFIPPKPDGDWVLDEQTCLWQPAEEP